MSELQSAIDALTADVLVDMPDARAEEDFVEIQRATERLEAERLRRLADLDRRGVYRRDGHVSAASWLVATFGSAWGSAREHVRLARALEQMPRTSAALAAGDVSMSAVKVLAGAREVDPDAFERCEPELVEAARVHSIGDLQRVATYWRQRVERERFERTEDRLRANRRLHASVTLGGMVRLDGDLDPESGETVLTALNAVVDAEIRSRTDEDQRTSAQRRADALTEVCRQWLDRSDRPSVAGERPHVTVTVPAEMLRRDREGAWEFEPGRAGEFDHTGPIDPEQARRLTCDASIMRVVLSARSEPLDVGRRTPIVPPSMRRAVVVRDRHCRFPGCDRPAPWSDAHHIRHWADGGVTAMPNLLLLCRRHHRLVHERFSLELVDGVPVFHRPDGSVLEDRAPP